MGGTIGGIEVKVPSVDAGIVIFGIALGEMIITGTPPFMRSAAGALKTSTATASTKNPIRIIIDIYLHQH